MFKIVGAQSEKEGLLGMLGGIESLVFLLSYIQAKGMNDLSLG
jgi:hypothetical protein